jgi:nitroreductase
MSLEQTFLDMLPSLNRCQRNWKDDAVPQEHIDLLLKVANYAPSKQNVNFFKVVAVTDAEHKKNLFRIADSQQGYADQGVVNYNTQVLAPLVLAFCINKDSTQDRMSENEKSERNYEVSANLNIGIACGSVATVASALGYATGFCACFDEYKQADYFKELTGRDDLKGMLLLGIGIPDAELPSNLCRDDTGRTYTRPRRVLERPDPITL